jgi:hypothetical protein
MTKQTESPRTIHALPESSDSADLTTVCGNNARYMTPASAIPTHVFAECVSNPGVKRCYECVQELGLEDQEQTNAETYRRIDPTYEDGIEDEKQSLKAREEKSIRTIDVTPTPAGSMAMFATILTGAYDNINERQTKRAKEQIAAVRAELDKWSRFLGNVTWEELDRRNK